MKKIVLFLLFAVLFLLPQNTVQAIENPLSKPNNKFGIHLLFPSELEKAAKLINSSGGDWGYVVIPLQASDRDLIKWQAFFNQARLLHIIPIIRLATDGDYFNTQVWRKGTYEDIVDSANFLNSLQWPTKNRYVSVFNEVNRGDEWGGSINPDEYAQLLSYAVTVFKSKNEDFFMISAGLDNAAPNQGQSYMNQYDYLRAMQKAVPGIFNQIDGIASHSYPNPAFSQPPWVISPSSIYSFQYERQLVRQLSNKVLPVFITETGWSGELVDDGTRAKYYQEAFANAWSDPNIAAVIPFLLQANSGPFKKFSFLTDTNSPTLQYNAIEAMVKVKGTPTVSEQVLGIQIPEKKLETKSFSGEKATDKRFTPSQILKDIIFWTLKL